MSVVSIAKMHLAVPYQQQKKQLHKTCFNFADNDGHYYRLGNVGKSLPDGARFDKSLLEGTVLKRCIVSPA